MLKIITVGILVIMMILAVGCGKTNESVKERDGVAPYRVFVEFTVPSSDSQVSDLLESLGSRIVEIVFNSNLVIVSLPNGMAVADMVETLNRNPLVEYAKPAYALDEIVVKFNVPYEDERVSTLLASLGSRVIYASEYADNVLVSVPEDKTVVDMVETLSRSRLVEYAEPDYLCYVM